MSAQTYKKLVVARFGETLRDSLEVVEAPMRKPGPTEILVRNIYAGVNLIDIPMTMGRTLNFTTPPFDLGLEAAGEVLAVGKNVTRFKPGDKVVTALFGNGFREYALIDANLALRVKEISPEVMALMISGSRASIALRVTARMKRGNMTVMVTAAVGGSGHFAVQLAKLEGNHVIGTCSSDDEEAMLYDMGCDRVINREKEDLGAVLKAEYPEGIQLIYDSFGGKIFDIALDNIAPRGRLIIGEAYAEHTRREEPLHAVAVHDKLIWKAATIHGFNLVEYAQFVPAHAQRLLDLYANEKIRVFLDPTPFTGVAGAIDALEHMLAWNNRGKVYVKIQDL